MSSTAVPNLCFYLSVPFIVLAYKTMSATEKSSDLTTGRGLQPHLSKLERPEAVGGKTQMAGFREISVTDLM